VQRSFLSVLDPPPPTETTLRCRGSWGFCLLTAVKTGVASFLIHFYRPGLSSWCKLLLDSGLPPPPVLSYRWLCFFIDVPPPHLSVNPFFHILEFPLGFFFSTSFCVLAHSDCRVVQHFFPPPCASSFSCWFCFFFLLMGVRIATLVSCLLSGPTRLPP